MEILTSHRRLFIVLAVTLSLFFCTSTSVHARGPGGPEENQGLDVEHGPFYFRSCQGRFSGFDNVEKPQGLYRRETYQDGNIFSFHWSAAGDYDFVRLYVYDWEEGEIVFWEDYESSPAEDVFIPTSQNARGNNYGWYLVAYRVCAENKSLPSEYQFNRVFKSEKVFGDRFRSGEWQYNPPSAQGRLLTVHQDDPQDVVFEFDPSGMSGLYGVPYRFADVYGYEIRVYSGESLLPSVVYQKVLPADANEVRIKRSDVFYCNHIDRPECKLKLKIVTLWKERGIDGRIYEGLSHNPTYFPWTWNGHGLFTGGDEYGITIGQADEALGTGEVPDATYRGSDILSDLQDASSSAQIEEDDVATPAIAP